MIYTRVIAVSGKTYPTSTDPIPAAPPPNPISAFANEQPNAEACKQADVSIYGYMEGLHCADGRGAGRKKKKAVPVVVLESDIIFNCSRLA